MASTQSKSTAARAAKNKDTTVAPSHAPPGKHIGDMLREAREERGLTIENIAEELMIRRFYLDALENGSFGELPERVYASGFVRAYANYIGMDVTTASEQFKRDAYGSRHASTYQVELSMPEPMVHSVVPGRAAIITALVVLGAIVGGLVYASRSAHDETAPTSIPAPIQEVPQADPATIPGATSNEAPAAEPEPAFIGGSSMNTPSVPQTNNAANDRTAQAAGANAAAPPQFAVAETSADPATDPAVVSAALPATTSAASLPSAAAVPATPKVDNRMVLEALKTAWVEVKDAKGSILFTSILKAGQLLPLPDNMKLFVTTGNAGGLRLLVDGQPQAPLGRTDEVKRDIALDPSTLAQR